VGNVLYQRERHQAEEIWEEVTKSSFQGIRPKIILQVGRVLTLLRLRGGGSWEVDLLEAGTSRSSRVQQGRAKRGLLAGSAALTATDEGVPAKKQTGLRVGRQRGTKLGGGGRGGNRRDSWNRRAGNGAPRKGSLALSGEYNAGAARRSPHPSFGELAWGRN